MRSLTPDIIIDYWYSERIHKQWFNSTPALDDEIRNQFESVWLAAANGELDLWMDTADGCLALCIILDQFPLNMFRGSARGFETESSAIRVSKHAIDAGLDKHLQNNRLLFLYMPLMHSESLQDHVISVQMFEVADLNNHVKFAHRCQDIVKRFGRFPHRNQILGRENTDAESDYLNSEGAFTG